MLHFYPYNNTRYIHIGTRVDIFLKVSGDRSQFLEEKINFRSMGENIVIFLS